MSVVDVTGRSLQQAMGWYHKMEYDLENDEIKNKFCLSANGDAQCGLERLP